MINPVKDLAWAKYASIAVTIVGIVQIISIARQWKHENITRQLAEEQLKEIRAKNGTPQS